MSVRFLALVCSAFLFLPFSSYAFSSSSSGKTVTFLPVVPTPSGAAGYQVSTASDGTVLLKSPKRISVPGGGTISVDVTGGIPRSSASAAIGRFARKALPIIGTGYALYELGQELGFTLENGGGSLVVTKDPDPALYCTEAPCYLWYVDVPSRIVGGTPEAVCRAAITASNQPGDAAAYVSNTSTQCNGVRVPSGLPIIIPIYNGGSRPPDEVSGTPSSVEEFEDAIAAKSGWPTSSALSRATVDAIKSGESLTVTPQTVTGPATSPGPVIQTVNNTNNTTTTSTTTHHHTYSGPSVTTTTTTTTVTINNITNEVIDSSTTTTEPVMPESSDEDEGAPTDTPLGEVPQLYEPKYPDGIVGVWNAKKAELLDTSLIDTLSQLMPAVGSVGTCPVWTIPLNFEFFDAGNLDVSVPCWLWDFAKVVIICSALLAARAIIFGG